MRRPAIAQSLPAPPSLALPPARELAVGIAVVGFALALTTLVVPLLESPAVGLVDASPLYLVPVVVAGLRFGLWAALATAVAAFLVYDLGFTEPRLNLTVADPREWLDLLLFLFVAIVVGRLAALGTERAQEAARRAAGETSLFAISRVLATAPDIETAGSGIVERLVRDARLTRAWIVVERATRSGVLADSLSGATLPASAFSTSLVRTAGDQPARWVRAHEASGPGRPASASGHASAGALLLKVRMEADDEILGWVRAERPVETGLPTREETRLLAL